MKLRVGVIYGSRSCEHDVSIISALQAAASLDRNEYEVELIYIGRDGTWYTGDALANVAFYRAFDPYRVTKVVPVGEDGKLVLRTARKRIFGSETVCVIDVCLTVMHGLNGEDGTLQGMLEMFNVPYTSCGVPGSAIGMDKVLMKQVFRANGLPVVEGVWFTRTEWTGNHTEKLDECESRLGYPVYVKPANLGSSIGISRAENRKELEESIETACAYDKRILVEKGITGLREVNCAAVGWDGEITLSEIEMPISKEEFLDFAAKYLPKGGAKGSKGGSKGMQSQARQIPAPIPAETAQRVREITKTVFRILDLKGVVRIDFIIAADGTLYINEANTIPGSLAFYLFEPIGMKYSALLDRMIECAIRANADRNSSVFSYDSALLNSVVSGGAKGKNAK